MYSPNWIGDAVMALPILSELKNKFPECELIVTGRPWVMPVYIFSPLVDRLVKMDEPDLRSFRGMLAIGKQLRELRLDRLYLLTDSFRSGWIGWLSRAKKRIGYSGQGRNIFLTEAMTKPGSRKHRSEIYIDLLKVPQTDLPLPELRITFDNIPDELHGLDLANTLVIIPGSVAASRTIPVEKWREILNYPIDEGLHVIIAGGKNDYFMGEILVKDFPGGKITNMAGKTDLGSSIGIISRCAGVIASDSGMGHFATAAGLKTVSIFGAGDPQVTAPRGLRCAWISADVDCSPCLKNTCLNKENYLICLKEIKADRVWALYKSL